MDISKPVLVTGINGYLGTFCALELLSNGFHVRGTVRSEQTAKIFRDAFASYVDVDDRLELCVADLTADEGWCAAVKGCGGILHVASPFPDRVMGEQDELFDAALEGTLRVLRHAAELGAHRVVVTSSLLAALEGNASKGEIDESYWGELCEHTDAYAASKIVAERAAWEFVESGPYAGQLALTTILPGLLLGPVMPWHHSTSLEVVGKLMRREVPGCPPLGWCVVDVRDVAHAHVAALTNDESVGKRYCCTGPFMWMREMAKVLNESGMGRVAPTRPIPGFVVRCLALFDSTLKLVVPRLNVVERVSAKSLQQDLDWVPRPAAETLADTARSLLALDRVSSS